MRGFCLTVPQMDVHSCKQTQQKHDSQSGNSSADRKMQAGSESKSQSFIYTCTPSTHTHRDTHTRQKSFTLLIPNVRSDFFLSRSKKQYSFAARRLKTVCCDDSVIKILVCVGSLSYGHPSQVVLLAHDKY